LAASSAQGLAFCTAETPVATVKQNAPASTANHFVCTPENNDLFFIRLTPFLWLKNSADFS
jgi:hypothetical protein